MILHAPENAGLNAKHQTLHTTRQPHNLGAFRLKNSELMLTSS